MDRAYPVRRALLAPTRSANEGSNDFVANPAIACRRHSIERDLLSLFKGRTLALLQRAVLGMAQHVGNTRSATATGPAGRLFGLRSGPGRQGCASGKRSWTLASSPDLPMRCRWPTSASR